MATLVSRPVPAVFVGSVAGESTWPPSTVWDRKVSCLRLQLRQIRGQAADGDVEAAGCRAVRILPVKRGLRGGELLW